MAQAQPEEIDTVEFIKACIGEKFDEAKARELFSLYCVDGGDKLQPPDIRKLLFDILEASEWPLVVPDSSLDAVLSELCLNVDAQGDSEVTWIEFKSFFVFLQDTPIRKLFDVTTRGINRELLNTALLVTVRPCNAPDENLFDRSVFQQKIQELLPQTDRAFVYFTAPGTVLALVLGNFDESVTERPPVELVLNEQEYVSEIRPFIVDTSLFPPIARAGGVTSKVARKVADTYLRVKQWDAEHFQIADKATRALNKGMEVAAAVDEKYRVQERLTSAAQSAVTRAQALDEKHQIRRRLSNTALQLDEQYAIREKFGAVVNKIKSNERVQNVTTSVVTVAERAGQTLDNLSRETSQLVQEKRSNVANNSQIEGDANNDTVPSAPQMQ